MGNVHVVLATEQWINNVIEAVFKPAKVHHRLEIDRYASRTTSKIKGRDFLRVVTTNGQRSVWAFVAMSDGENRAIGKWKEGDIFKAASWASPAKHRRGNVYEDLPLCGIKSWTGPEYLR